MPSLTRSPSSSSSSSSYEPPSPSHFVSPKAHKWDNFEVRTLICLIIKGEHRISPDDPMYLADRLNNALNPERATTDTAEKIYGADIPMQDVQAMLRRIMSKKKHAIDISDRHKSNVVTKRKIAAFMRGLEYFDGSEEEWKVGGRRDRMLVERAKMRRRMMVRKEGGKLSPQEQEDRDRRLAMLRSPRAQRLLVGWGIGASFWEDSVEPIRTRRSPSPEVTTTRPINAPSATTAALSHAAAKDDDDPFVVPSGRLDHASAGPLPGACTLAWMNLGVSQCTVPTTADVTAFGGCAGGFGPSAPTPLTAGYGGGQAASYGAANPGGPQPWQTPGRGGYGGAYRAATPLLAQFSRGEYGAKTAVQPELWPVEQNGDIYKAK